ncbi:hypothetical protein DNHGIG_29450 [Collibacillus ludicampi]|uniref:Uncharacterized protein n=1 Tax=Collibacillus ludicampi TaxID=2771369 RepID=A0AAV4LI18_9BACL|nr:hypothetical protein DNHGIG_29450 [Collibacillus ludicampi]
MNLNSRPYQEINDLPAFVCKLIKAAHPIETPLIMVKHSLLKFTKNIGPGKLKNKGVVFEER